MAKDKSLRTRVVDIIGKDNTSPAAQEMLQLAANIDAETKRLERQVGQKTNQLQKSQAQRR